LVYNGHIMTEIFNEDIKNKMKEELLREHPIEDLVRFNEIDLQEKLERSAYMVIRYDDLLKKEEMIYQQLEDKYDALVGQRYDYYRFEYDKELQKPEIEKYYLPMDKKIRMMKDILLKQKLRVDFFKVCLNGLKSMQWNMKTFSSNLQRGY